MFFLGIEFCLHYIHFVWLYAWCCTPKFTLLISEFLWLMFHHTYSCIVTGSMYSYSLVFFKLWKMVVLSISLRRISYPHYFDHLGYQGFHWIQSISGCFFVSLEGSEWKGFQSKSHSSLIHWPLCMVFGHQNIWCISC